MPFPSLPTSPDCRISPRTAKSLGAPMGSIKGSNAAAWQQNGNNSSAVLGTSKRGGSQQQQRSPPAVKPLSDSLLRLQSNNNNNNSNSPSNSNANTATNYYPVSPREYCSPEAVRMSMLETIQLSQSQRLKESLYGGVRSVVGQSPKQTKASTTAKAPPPCWSPSSSLLLNNNTAISSTSPLGGGGGILSSSLGGGKVQQLSPSPPSSPLHAITSATDAKISPLFNSSGESVRRALLAINKEASSKRRRGRRVPPPPLPPPQPQHQHNNDTSTTISGDHGGVRGPSSLSPVNSTTNNNNATAPSNEIGSFGRVNGVYVPHPHSLLLPWWVPKVTISDAVRCAQSTLGRDLTLHEVNYMRQRRGEDPLDASSAKILLSGGSGGLGLGSPKKLFSSPSSSRNKTKKAPSSSLSPSPPSSSSSPRDRNILRYNVHAQGPAYPPQVLYRSAGGVGGGCASSNNVNNNNTEHADINGSNPHSPHPQQQDELNGDDEVVATTIPNAYSTPTTTTAHQPSPTQQQSPFHQPQHQHRANTTSSPIPSPPATPTSNNGRRRSDLVIDCRLKAHFDDVTGAMRMLSQ